MEESVQQAHHALVMTQTHRVPWLPRRPSARQAIPEPHLRHPQPLHQPNPYVLRVSTCAAHTIPLVAVASVTIAKRLAHVYPPQAQRSSIRMEWSLSPRAAPVSLHREEAAQARGIAVLQAWVATAVRTATLAETNALRQLVQVLQTKWHQVQRPQYPRRCPF
jgi:hypothetical protein